MFELAELRIDLGAIRFNLERIREMVGPRVAVMAVLKGDGYGHGAAVLARHLEAWGVDRFAVAHLRGGRHLRESGVRGRILILQPDFHIDRGAYLEHGFECCLSGLHDIGLWREMARPVDCHLLVDTGMGREGVLPGETATNLQAIAENPSLRLVGLATHFATADEPDLEFAHRQETLFKGVLNHVPGDLRAKIKVHAANSGAIINMPASHFDMVRPGIWLYGQYTGAGMFRQRPALSLYARLTLVRDLPADTSIGYGRSYVTEIATRVGLVSVGYADGFTREKGNRSMVLVGDRLRPVVGRVNMDQLVIDLGPGAPEKVGDSVLLLGGELEPALSLGRDAEQLRTITYERCCQLGMRLPRVYHGLD